MYYLPNTRLIEWNRESAHMLELTGLIYRQDIVASTRLVAVTLTPSAAFFLGNVDNIDLRFGAVTLSSLLPAQYK